MEKQTIIIMGLLLLLCTMPLASAQESDGEINVFGLELEKLLNIGSSLLALALSSLTLLSYKRSRNKRLLYVNCAFMLFAIKSFLVGAEIFFGEWPWVDPIASIFDFAILCSFFLGAIKK